MQIPPCRHMPDVAILALCALAVGQIVAADSIPVPNGEFKIYKPVTDYTVGASLPSGNVWVRGVGDNLSVLGGSANYDDGTSGTVVDCPGWVRIHGGNPDLLNNGVDGSVGCNVFAAWGGDVRVQSASSLGSVARYANYTISAMVNGPVANGPVAFFLVADGAPLTPSASVGPVPPVTTWQLITRTFNVNDLSAHVGKTLTIIIGVQDENDLSDRMIVDNVTLEVENLPPPGTLLIMR